jgi:hypothetical protein
MSGPFKPVGVDSDSLFPPRVEARLERVWNVRTQAEATAALTAIQADGVDATLRVPHGATLTLTASINLPHLVRKVIIDGSVAVNANVSAFTKKGYVTESIGCVATAGIDKGDYKISLSETLASNNWGVDQWLLIGSSTQVLQQSGSTGGERHGVLRRITAVDSASVANLDSAFPRQMGIANAAFPGITANDVRVYQVTLAPSVSFEGSGEVYYVDPSINTVAMFSMVFVENPTFGKGLHFHHGGSTCLSITNCVGGSTDAHIERLLDDNISHYGYGVSWNGATRDFIVRGVIERCRHAVTTITGPNALPSNTGVDWTGFPYRGEPEHCRFEALTLHCSNKPVDSHAPGIGLSFKVQDVGSNGGIQIRSDGAFVESAFFSTPSSQPPSTGTNLVSVADGLAVPPMFGPIRIDNWPFATYSPIKLGSDAIFTSEPYITYTAATPPADFDASGAGKAIGLTGVTEFYDNVNFTNATVTPAVTGTKLALRHKSVYKIECYISYNVSAAADMAISWDVPAGATFRWSTFGARDANASPYGSAVFTEYDAADVAALGGNGGGYDTGVQVMGILVTDAAGVLELKAALATAGAYTLSIPAASLTARRIK